MKSIKPILRLLQQVADNEGTSDPLIVGGIPRGKVMGTIKETFNDIDLTTGDGSIKQLGKEFAIKLHKHIPLTMKQATDGHISLYLQGGLNIDFSSNFLVPNIDQILYNKGIKNPSDMMKELYSRDFTCNTLLMNLTFDKVKDLTGQAIDDIQDKMLRTCLSPDLTFKFNTNRIVRILYLSAKLDFDVEPAIMQWVKSNPRYMMQSEQSYIAKNLDKALTSDADRTIYLLNKMGLWQYVPVTQKLYPYYQKHTVREPNVIR